MPEYCDAVSQRNMPVSKLEVMVVIVDWDRIRDVEQVMQRVFKGIPRMHLLYVIHGVGTANSKILDMFGLDSTEKGVLFCLEPKTKMAELRHTLEVALALDIPGNGILFSLPLSNLCSPFKTEKRIEIMDNEVPETMNDLIVTVVNQGYSDDLMDAAKLVGARGGTVLRARKIGMEEAIKRFGISVQLEKEVLLILAPRTIGREVVKAITPFCGKESEAKGIMFSIAADNIAGLNFE